MFDRIEDFTRYARLELGLAGNTLSAYTSDLTLLGTAAADLGYTMEDLGPDQVSRLLLSLKADRDWSPATCARALIALRMFSRWLVLEKVLSRDRVALAALPTAWETLPEVLSPEEVDLLLDATQGSTHRLRDRLALELLYGTGARASEVIGITLADFKDARRLLHLRGKGGKERVVPLGEPARRALDRYLRDERPRLAAKDEGGDLLLLSSRGAPLSRQALWKIVHTTAERAGLGRRVYTHLLRHSAATHLLHGGADLRVVQELLGHANLTTTQRYTQVDQRRLRAVHRRFHPRA